MSRRYDRQAPKFQDRIPGGSTAGSGFAWQWGRTPPTNGTSGTLGILTGGVYEQIPAVDGTLGPYHFENWGNRDNPNFVPEGYYSPFGGLNQGTANKQLASGMSLMRQSGNIYANVLRVANGVQASATGLDKIVDAFTLPAFSFDISGRMLQFTCWGNFANNVNAKRVKVIYGATNINPLTNGTVTVTGGTVIVDSGSITTTGGGSWMLQGVLMKTGVGTPTAAQNVGTNQQESMTTGIVFAATHSGVGAYTDQSFTESAAALIVVTLNDATATTDLTYLGCEITGYN